MSYIYRIATIAKIGGLSNERRYRNKTKTLIKSIFPQILEIFLFGIIDTSESVGV